MANLNEIFEILKARGLDATKMDRNSTEFANFLQVVYKLTEPRPIVTRDPVVMSYFTPTKKRVCVKDIVNVNTTPSEAGKESNLVSELRELPRGSIVKSMLEKKDSLKVREFGRSVKQFPKNIELIQQGDSFYLANDGAGRILGLLLNYYIESMNVTDKTEQEKIDKRYTFEYSVHNMNMFNDELISLVGSVAADTDRQVGEALASYVVNNVSESARHTLVVPHEDKNTFDVFAKNISKRNMSSEELIKFLQSIKDAPLKYAIYKDGERYHLAQGQVVEANLPREDLLQLKKDMDRGPAVKPDKEPIYFLTAHRREEGEYEDAHDAITYNLQHTATVIPAKELSLINLLVDRLDGAKKALQLKKDENLHELDVEGLIIKEKNYNGISADQVGVLIDTIENIYSRPRTTVIR